MAIFLPSAIIGAISGSLASLTFKQRKGSNVVSTRIRRRDNPSTSQNLTRARWTSVLRAWKTLTSNERQAWRSAAVDLPRMNRLGIPRTLSGFQFFTSHNSTALIVGSSIPIPPPTTQVLPSLLGLKVSAVTFPLMILSYSINSPLQPVFLIVQGSRPYVALNSPSEPFIPPPVTWPFKAWRYITHIQQSNGVHNTDITSAFQGQFGFPVASENFGIRVHTWHPQAQASAPAIVVGNTIP